MEEERRNGMKRIWDKTTDEGTDDWIRERKREKAVSTLVRMQSHTRNPLVHPPVKIELKSIDRIANTEL